MRKLHDAHTVRMAAADQCQHGAEATRGKHKCRPLEKPTGFMSNPPGTLKALRGSAQAQAANAQDQEEENTYRVPVPTVKTQRDTCEPSAEPG